MSFSNPHTSLTIDRQPAVAIHAEASNNAEVSASMMIGRATAVYCVRISHRFMTCRIVSVRQFAKLHPAKINFPVFWSQSAKYCPRENFNVYGILYFSLIILILIKPPYYSHIRTDYSHTSTDYSQHGSLANMVPRARLFPFHGGSNRSIEFGRLETSWELSVNPAMTP